METSMIVLIDKELNKLMVLNEDGIRAKIADFPLDGRIPVTGYEKTVPVCTLYRVLALSQPMRIIVAKKDDDWTFYTNYANVHEIPLPRFNEWTKKSMETWAQIDQAAAITRGETNAEPTES
jgi:hypothetical protein